MKNSKLKQVPLIALAALPLTVGLVFAQTTGSTTAQTPQRVQPVQPGQQRTPSAQNQQNQRQQSSTNYSDVFLKNLAAQLGISVDKLKAAAVSASKTTLDQGVKAGDFPADMAQNMGQRLQDNPFALAGGRGGHGMKGDFGGRGGRDNDQGFQGGQPGQMQPGQVRPGQPGQQGQQQGQNMNRGQRGGFGQAISAAVAKTLGLTEQQLFTQLQGGQTIAQIAQAKGVSTATLHAAAVNALKTQLQANVKAGRLTQAQADQMITRAQADPNFGLNFGRGGRDGGQDGGPRGGTNNGTDTSAAADSNT